MNDYKDNGSDYFILCKGIDDKMWRPAMLHNYANMQYLTNVGPMSDDKALQSNMKRRPHASSMPGHRRPNIEP